MTPWAQLTRRQKAAAHIDRWIRCRPIRWCARLLGFRVSPLSKRTEQFLREQFEEISQRMWSGPSFPKLYKRY